MRLSENQRVLLCEIVVGYRVQNQGKRRREPFYLYLGDDFRRKRNTVLSLERHGLIEYDGCTLATPTEKGILWDYYNNL